MIIIRDRLQEAVSVIEKEDTVPFPAMLCQEALNERAFPDPAHAADKQVLLRIIFKPGFQRFHFGETSDEIRGRIQWRGNQVRINRIRQFFDNFQFTGNIIHVLPTVGRECSKRFPEEIFEMQEKLIREASGIIHFCEIITRTLYAIRRFRRPSENQIKQQRTDPINIGVKS